MRHPKSTEDDVAVLLGTFGQLWEAGYNLNWSALHTILVNYTKPPIKTGRLPPYAFTRTSLWTNPQCSPYVEGEGSKAAAPMPATSSSAVMRFADREGMPE